MVIAFQNFERIISLDGKWRQHREWLKPYQGLCYSIAEKEKHKIKWQTEPKKYDDAHWNHDINCIKELPYRTRIEFDDHNERGEKDKEKIKRNVEATVLKLKENKFGFIRSTHNGASDYLWVEFNRNLTEEEKKRFLIWIAPEGSEVDLNFASHKKVFPVLFTIHWKHSDSCELPIEYFEGEQIDYDKLEIKIEDSKVIIKTVKNRKFEYITGIKEAFESFGLKKQTKQFEEIVPFFYDKSGMFWLWDKKDCCWKLTDEVDLLNMIEEVNNKDIISSKARQEIINSLKQRGRKLVPKPIKNTWIQFKDKIYDITTGEKIEATPEYFVTNPIPWEVSGNPLTPTIDKIFNEWVGEEYVKTLYQIIAYCCLSNYPINRLFCFIGAGLNGKSKFLELLKTFIGKENICSTELDLLLTSRFEVTKLHKKLVCLMGETNFNEMKNTSILKKLTGGDVIGFEYKNKLPFDDINYSKILIATNNLPVTNDKSMGFYRRWMIIDFPNQFTEKKNILDDIPPEEYNNLATNCVIILNELIKKREFEKEGTIEERQKKFEDRSDPLERFIKEFTEEEADSFIWKFEFEKRLNEWCIERKFRQMSEIVIGKKMKEKGYVNGLFLSNWLIESQRKQLRAWSGIKWKGESNQVNQDKQVY